MLFTTENSTYEIDDRRIRRLEGVNTPTPRQGGDGEWKPFHAVSEVTVGLGVVIIWRFVDGVAQATCTSPVRQVIQASH